MLKFLLVVIVVVAVFAWLTRRSDKKEVERPARKAAPPKLEEIVSCAHCGVHLPQRDAVQRGDRHYCGLPHADAGPRDRSS